MRMPKQKPGRSKQNYETPADFLRAVRKRFGDIDYDLAASSKNAKAERFFTKKDNSLEQDWKLLKGNHAFLNPPFGRIVPWALKCASTFEEQVVRPRCIRKISFLVPASIASNWYEDYVYPYALTLALKPRLAFDGLPPNPKTGKQDCYPKDLILAVYDAKGARAGEFEFWHWDK